MTATLRYLAHRLFRPERYAHLDRLLREQPASRAEALARQRQRLVDIVRYAAARTDFYARRFAEVPGLASGEFALADLPILRKDEVVANLDAMLSRDADRATARLGHTGGSTGKPLAFWYDEAKHELMRAGMARSYMGSGWRPGQKILNFWGAPQDTRVGGVFGGGWSDVIAAERTIPAYGFTRESLARWAGAVRAYRPVLLQGYASILAELARHVVETKTAMPASLIGVYSTAEVLDPAQRELMEQAFGCRVYNQYGSREVPNIACECRHGRMHVFTDMVQLESVAEGGEDKLLVTSLTNRLMPMIRYDIGDSGRLLDGDCDCGWPFPLMEIGLCRANDLIRLPGGRTVHPSCLNRLLYGLTGVRQYQWVQEAPDRLVLSLAAAESLAPEAEAALREGVRRDVAPEISFELRYVAEIERTVSGKHRFVVSKVAAR